MISCVTADHKAVKEPRQIRKPRTRKTIMRPPLESARIYTRREAALACATSESSLIRATRAGHLAELCNTGQGGKVKYSGQQLLDWLNAGGKTK